MIVGARRAGFGISVTADLLISVVSRKAEQRAEAAVDAGSPTLDS